MVDIIKKEEERQDIPSIHPEEPIVREDAPEKAPEQLPKNEGMAPESAPEQPEQQIEQAKEQVAEAKEDATPSKPPRVSPIMKDDEILEELKDIMNMDKPKQIKVLVYLAFKKGIHYAADIAKKLKDPYLLDEFHDTLVNELYLLLLKNRKIKQK